MPTTRPSDSLGGKRTGGKRPEFLQQRCATRPAPASMRRPRFSWIYATDFRNMQRPMFKGLSATMQNLPFMRRLRQVNSRASKFSVQRITDFMNSVFVSLEAETANLPLAKSGGRLPRRVNSARPALPKAFEAHAMYPPGFLLLLILR
jgi:hypothetical protein